MKILLTGGSGFIGEHVVRMLVERNQEIHILQRRIPEKPVPGTKLFLGDVTDERSVEAAMEGCDRVIHMAALAKAGDSDERRFDQVNVHGTANVLKAAVRNNVKHLVYTSTCAFIELVPGIASEVDLRPAGLITTRYGKSKAEGEDLVRAYAQAGLSFSIVYPTRVYGPGRLSESNAATKVIDLYRRNRLPFLIDGGNQPANWAYVEDVARGHLLALEKGRNGRSYLLGGANVSLLDVYNLIDTITGHRHLRFGFPRSAARFIVGLEEMRAKVLSVDPRGTRAWLDSVIQPSAFSSDRAVAELGYNITSLEDGMRATLQWLDQYHREEGEST